MKILHQVSITICIISVVKVPSTNITRASPQPHILHDYRTNMLCTAVFIISYSNSQSPLRYPCMTSHGQSIPDLSSNFCVQMSIKIHLLYWGIPVKHHINVKVSNHLNHTDFLHKYTFMCQLPNHVIKNCPFTMETRSNCPCAANGLTRRLQLLINSITHVLKDKHDNR